MRKQEGAIACHRCQGEWWTCEAHPDQPWPHGNCAGPGEPCLLCNDAEPPEHAPGFVSYIDASQPIDLAHWPPDPPPPVPTREELWTIARVDGVKVSARLFVRGEWGFEAQVLHDGVLFVAQRFNTRGQAESWAHVQWTATQKGGRA